MKRLVRSLIVCAVVVGAAVLTYLGLSATPGAVAIDADAEYAYLSDITPQSAKVGWGSLGLDKASNGAKISMRVEGSTVTFDKGIFAHATSNLVYDLSAYDFDYFTAYVGINTSSSSGNGVKFLIYTSKDGKSWELQECGLPAVTMPSTDATYVKVDIREAEYLWLKADANGANGNDHSAYGDAKLVKASYRDTATKTVEEYDSLIAEKYAQKKGVMDAELELLTLQRDLVKKTGQYQLKQLFAEGKEYQETFEWVFEDLEMLKLYMMGGQPDGSYKTSFEVLTRLRLAHGADASATGLTSKGQPLALLYRKMMLTLALTHARTVNFWAYGTAGEDKSVPNPNISDAVLRYEIYKEMYGAGKLDAVFDQLEIEEMRYILGAQINDDEIRWAREYAMSKSNRLSGYAYMSYKNVNTALYRRPEFFAQYADISAYETKYKLTGLDVKNEAYYPRLWMIMETGGVCWQISNVGQSMVSALGIPSILIGQPGHSAYLVYGIDGQGRSYWALWNNVGGWTVANTSAYNGTRGSFRQRLMATWGNGSYASGSTVTYVFLASAALDDYDNFVKAETEVRLAEALGTNAEKELRYRKALATQPINLDAWLGLINLYKADEGKTQDEYLALAEEVAAALKYYPHPTYDMVNLIGKSMKDAGHQAAVARLLNETLAEGAKAPTSVSQYSMVRQMANFFLGKVDTEVATFSFDGEEAGVLKLAAKYNGTEAAFDFKLTASDSWSPYVTEGKVKLTAEQLAKINATDGIKVHLIGMNYDEKNIYTIKINEGALPAGLYGNDLENKVMGATEQMEWRLAGATEWTSYGVAQPELTGDKVLQVRAAATGTTLASAAQSFEFTEDVVDPRHVYISADNLAVKSFSSENVRSNKNEYEYARNALDGNLYTHWHTDRTTDKDAKFIVIELSEEEYISRFEYVPVPNYKFGVVKEAELAASLDGENWVPVATVTDWENNDQVKRVDFEPVRAKYVKFTVLKNYDYLQKAGANYFVSAAMFNLYEDATKTVLPAVRLEYDTREITNKDVTVRLVNLEPEKVIKIDNNGGSESYTFAENGEFQFEFSNAEGERGTVTAKVDWIDKVAPKATVNYEKTYTTGVGGGEVEAVKAVIELSEEVKFLSELKPVVEAVGESSVTEDNKVIVGYKYGDFYLERANDKKLVVMFTYNGGFNLEFVDMAGNEGAVRVLVDSLTVTDGGEEVKVPDGTQDTGGTDLGADDEGPGEIVKPGENDDEPSENEKPSGENKPVATKPGTVVAVATGGKKPASTGAASNDAGTVTDQKEDLVIEAEGGETHDDEAEQGTQEEKKPEAAGKTEEKSGGTSILPFLIGGGVVVLVGWGVFSYLGPRGPKGER